MLLRQGSAEHLPDAVTIVTMLHFLPTARRDVEGGRQGGAGTRKRKGGREGTTAFLWEQTERLICFESGESAAHHGSPQPDIWRRASPFYCAAQRRNAHWHEASWWSSFRQKQCFKGLKMLLHFTSSNLIRFLSDLLPTTWIQQMWSINKLLFMCMRQGSFRLY